MRPEQEEYLRGLTCRLFIQFPADSPPIEKFIVLNQFKSFSILCHAVDPWVTNQEWPSSLFFLLPGPRRAAHIIRSFNYLLFWRDCSFTYGTRASSPRFRFTKNWQWKSWSWIFMTKNPLLRAAWRVWLNRLWHNWQPVRLFDNFQCAWNAPEGAKETTALQVVEQACMSWPTSSGLVSDSRKVPISANRLPSAWLEVNVHTSSFQT